MVDFVTLEYRLWDGDYERPYAFYYADASKTITVALLDLQGNTVCSQNVSVNAGLNKIKIGEMLYNCYISNSFSDGYYVLQIGSAYITFVVSQGGSMSGSSIFGEYTGKVKKIIVWDTKTGLYLDLPPDTKAIPLGQFITFVYAHDDISRLGALGVCQGTGCRWTGWARYAVIEIEVRFNSIDDMFSYLANYIASSDQSTAEVIGKIANSSKADAVKIAAMFHIMTPIGDLVNWKIDIDNLKIVIDVAVRLGWGWDKVWGALKYAIAGAVAGAGIAAGIGVAVGSFGAGSVIGGAIAGAAMGLAYKLISSSNDKGWSDRISNIGQQGITNVTNATKDALSTLDYYYQQGQVSDQAYNDLKAKILEIKNVAVNAIQEVVEEAKNCYKAGYDDCKRKYMMYTMGAGAGGLVLGTLLGRR